MVDLTSQLREGFYGAAGFNPAAPKDAGGNTLLVQNGFKPNGSTFESKYGKGTRRTGQQGRCYDFDGTDDIVTVDNQDLNISGDLTLTARFNWDGAGGTSQYLVAFGEADEVLEDNTIYGIYINGGNNKIFYFHEYGAGNNVIVDPSITLTSGVDYNLVVTRNASTKTVTFYVDGVALGSGTYTNVPAGGTASKFSLGAISGLASTYYDGKLWDVRVEDSIWTADNIAHYASFGRIGTEGTYLGWWKCDEQAGTTSYDSSGNGYHGTIANATLSTFHATQDIYSFQNNVGFNLASNYFARSEPLVTTDLSTLSLTARTASGDFVGLVAGELYFGDNSTIRVVYSQSTTLSGGEFDGYELSFIVQMDDESEPVIGLSGDAGADFAVIVAGRQVSSGYSVTLLSGSVYQVTLPSAVLIDVPLSDNIGLVKYTGQSSKPFKASKFWLVKKTETGYVYTKTLGSNVTNAFIPRDESNTTQDVLGNTLQYTGVRPNDGALINSNCVTLNGTNQAVRVADNTDLDITDNLTVSVWAKNDLASLSATEYVIGKYDSGDNEREWGIAVNSSQQMLAVIGSSDGTSVTTQTTDAAITTDSVNHLAFTFSGGTVKLYVNGVEVASTASASHPSTLNNETADLTIGSILSVDTPTNCWDGQIFDSRIYAGDSTVLTDAEILSIYENPEANINFTGQTLAAHYKLAEGAGTVVQDASGNGNDGIIENAGSNWAVLQDNVHFNINSGCTKRMYFDGTNDYIQLASNVSLTGDFIIKFTAIFDDDLNGHIVSANPGIAGDSLADRVYITSGANANVFIRSNNDQVNLGAVTIDGQAKVIELRRSGSDISLYADGVLINTETVNSRSFDFNNFGNQHADVTGVPLLSGVVYDYEFTNGAGTVVCAYQGYGNTDADWVDQIGSNNGTVSGSPSAIYFPGDDSSSGNDVFGNALSNPAVNGHNGAESDINFNPDSVPVNANIVVANDGDGSSHVEIPDNAAFDIADNLTVMCWAKNDSSSIVGDEYLFCKYDSGANKREWAIALNATNDIRVRFGDPADGTFEGAVDTDPVSNIDQYHHYGFTFESGAVKVYLDGVEISNTVFSGSIPATLHTSDTPATIFAFLNSGVSTDHWNGAIEHCRIYSGTSAPLTAAQMAQVYAAPEKLLTFAGQTLVCAHELMSDTLDWSGNNLHGENSGITFTKYTVPTAYSFGDTLTATYNHFKREASSVKEDRFLLYRESLENNSKLSAVEAYTT